MKCEINLADNMVINVIYICSPAESLLINECISTYNGNYQDIKLAEKMTNDIRSELERVKELVSKGDEYEDW